MQTHKYYIILHFTLTISFTCFGQKDYYRELFVYTDSVTGGLCNESILLDYNGTAYYEAGCEGKSVIGVGKWNNKEGSITLDWMPLPSFQFIRSVRYSYDSSYSDPHIFLTDVFGDTVSPHFSFGHKRWKNYKSKLNDQTCFLNTVDSGIAAKNEYFALSSFYSLYGNYVVFKLPADSVNTISIQVNLPAMDLGYSSTGWTGDFSMTVQYAYEKLTGKNKEWLRASFQPY